MCIIKVGLTFFSSDPETIAVLHSKLAKAEWKKAAKKSKTHVTNPKSVGGKRTKQVADDSRSDEEENIDTSGGKWMILVKCVYQCLLPFPLDNYLQLVRQITLLLNRLPSLADQGLPDMASSLWICQSIF